MAQPKKKKQFKPKEPVTVDRSKFDEAIDVLLKAPALPKSAVKASMKTKAKTVIPAR